MANNGRPGTILQSIQEIGSFVGSRIQAKVAESPMVANIAQGAAAKMRAAVQAPKDAAPAEVVSVEDREPGADAGDHRGSSGTTLLAQGLKHYAGSIPAFARLLWKLIADPRVPVRHKLILGGAAAYLVSPFDIIPDRIAGVGQLDDFAVVVAALDIVLNHTDTDIVHSHWSGDPRTLDGIRRVVGVASQLRGGKVRRWLLKSDSSL